MTIEPTHKQSSTQYDSRVIVDNHRAFIRLSADAI